jgi:hypothetical protein
MNLFFYTLCFLGLLLLVYLGCTFGLDLYNEWQYRQDCRKRACAYRQNVRRPS